MDLTLNNAVMGVELSGIRQFTYLVRDTPGACALTIGEPDLNTPDVIKEAAKAALDANDTHYPPGNGYPYALEAISKFEAEAHGLHYAPSEVILTVGATEALFASFSTILNPGDEVIIPTPAFGLYEALVQLQGGVPVSLPTEHNHFQIVPEELKAAITDRTKAIILTSPNNPTGVVYSRQTLEGLAELLRRKSTQFGHPIYLIADEPYRELVYDGVEVPFLPTIYPNTLVCYSYSKSLSLPGERIGYVCVPSCVEGQADVLHAVAGAARSSGHVCPPTLVQLALQRCADARPDLAAYDANRRLLYRELTQMGYECIPPQGAFYIFVRVPDGDDVAFSQRAKLEHDLLVVPSTAFHCPGFLRLSYCVSHDMILRSLPAFRAIREKYQ